MNEIESLREAIDLAMDAKRNNASYLAIWKFNDRIVEYLNKRLDDVLRAYRAN